MYIILKILNSGRYTLENINPLQYIEICCDGSDTSDATNAAIQNLIESLLFDEFSAKVV